MWQLIEANWVAFLIVAVLAVLVALWIIGRAKKPRERSHRPDVLDEGVGPAKRNQALIDAPPAFTPPTINAADTPAPAPVEREQQPPVTPDGLAGTGTAVAAAVLANEPGSDEDIATDHHTTEPEPEAEAAAPPATENAAEDASVQPAANAVPDSEAVATAVKIHEGAHATDDLSRIKGVGPKLVSMLGSMGISRYDQIAAWSDEDVQAIDAQMGNFKGRIERDNWREQARLLSQGDTSAYEEKFGKL